MLWRGIEPPFSLSGACDYARSAVACLLAENQDVMMEVKIGDIWKRVHPRDAIRAKRNTQNLSVGPAEMTSQIFFAPDPNAMDI